MPAEIRGHVVHLKHWSAISNSKKVCPLTTSSYHVGNLLLQLCSGFAWQLLSETLPDTSLTVTYMTPQHSGTSEMQWNRGCGLSLRCLHSFTRTYILAISVHLHEDVCIKKAACCWSTRTVTYKFLMSTDTRGIDHLYKTPGTTSQGSLFQFLYLEQQASTTLPHWWKSALVNLYPTAQSLAINPISVYLKAIPIWSTPFYERT